MHNTDDPGSTRFDVGQPVLGQHRLHDGKRVLCGIVENAAIDGEVEQAQPRPDLGRVARVQLRSPALGKPGDDAVKESLLAGVELDAHCERLAQHILGIEVRLFGQQPELKQVRSPQFLLPLERLEQQHALGKGARHRCITTQKRHGYAGTLGVDWVASRGTKVRIRFARNMNAHFDEALALPGPRRGFSEGYEGRMP